MVYITGIRVGLVRMGNMHLGLGRGLVSCALIVDAGYIVCKVDVDSETPRGQHGSSPLVSTR